jgi:hypothetical protein
MWARLRHKLRFLAGRGTFLRHALGLVGLGMAIGVPAALAAGRYFESVLYGGEPDSLPTLAGAVAILAAVTLVAALLPALRATRVDPAIAPHD